MQIQANQQLLSNPFLIGAFLEGALCAAMPVFVAPPPTVPNNPDPKPRTVLSANPNCLTTRWYERDSQGDTGDPIDQQLFGASTSP